MFVLVLAVGFSECADPVYDLQMDAERIAGMGVERCGGPTSDGVSSVVDQECVASNVAAGTPYSAWSAREDDEGVVYDGVIGFVAGGAHHTWRIEDRRSVDGPLTVVRCVDAVCQPRECLDYCDRRSAGPA